MNTVKSLRNPILALAILLLATGCSWFGWLPWVDKEEEVDARASLERIEVEVDLNREWRRSVGAGLGKKYITMGPVVLGDRIFAADAFGRVQAFDRFSGERQWDVRVDRPARGWFARINPLHRRDYGFVAALGAGEGMVLVGTMNADLIALDAQSGEEKWRRTMSSEVLARPTVSNGQLYAQTQDGRLAALSSEDGREIWVYDTQVPNLTLRGDATPVVRGGAVFAGFATGRIAVFQERNGELIWDHRVMLPQGRSELARMVDVDAPVLPASSAVYAASYQGRLKALRPQDGSVIWERDASTNRALVEGRGNIYIVDHNDVVRAIDQRTGEQVWEQRGLLRRNLSSPVAFSGYLALGDDDGYLHLLSQRDGRFVGRTRVDRRGIRSQPLLADGVLYVYGNSGRLAAIQPEPRD